MWSVEWYYTLVEHFNSTGGTRKWQGRLQSSKATVPERIEKKGEAVTDSWASSDRRQCVFSIHQRSQRLEGFQVFFCSRTLCLWPQFQEAVLLRNLLELMLFFLISVGLLVGYIPDTCYSDQKVHIKPTTTKQDAECKTQHLSTRVLYTACVRLLNYSLEFLMTHFCLSNWP